MFTPTRKLIIALQYVQPRTEERKVLQFINYYDYKFSYIFVYVLFVCLGFYGLETFVDYLMPN